MRVGNHNFERLVCGNIPEICVLLATLPRSTAVERCGSYGFLDRPNKVLTRIYAIAIHENLIRSKVVAQTVGPELDILGRQIIRKKSASCR